MKDNSAELLPLVDNHGRVIGSATRGRCHDGSKLLHPVVHVHVIDSQRRVYLQHRPEWKDTQPGKWDTAVGGHIDYGEQPDVAAVRETREEIGLALAPAQVVAEYVFESDVEAEYVYSYAKYLTDTDPQPAPSAELDGGRFWTRDEIEAAIGQGILTPNFEQEYLRHLRPLL